MPWWVKILPRRKFRPFNAASVWGRISVVAAGPIFNFILAFVLAVIIVGFVGYDPAEVLEVDKIQQLQRQGFRMETLLQNMTDIMWILQKICMYICI